jgi:hypothetical protein
MSAKLLSNAAIASDGLEAKPKLVTNQWLYFHFCLKQLLNSLEEFSKLRLVSTTAALHLYRRFSTSILCGKVSNVLDKVFAKTESLWKPCG